MYQHAQLISVFLVETGFHHVGQAGLEILTSSEQPTSASQSDGNTGMSHLAWPSVKVFAASSLVSNFQHSFLLLAGSVDWE